MEEKWVEEWQKGELDMKDDGLSWIRAKPAEVKAMMIAFPPSCIVVATRELRVPAPGTHGVVVSYFHDIHTRKVTLGVAQSPTSNLAAQCEAEWLERVGVWKGLSPEKVQAIIDMPNLLKS